MRVDVSNLLDLFFTGWVVRVGMELEMNQAELSEASHVRKTYLILPWFTFLQNGLSNKAIDVYFWCKKVFF